MFDQFDLVDHVALPAAAGVGPTECLLFVFVRAKRRKIEEEIIKPPIKNRTRKNLKGSF